jgi:Flp pilus assembly protein protease CpaA
MTIGFIFWLLMLLWLVFGAWTHWSAATPPNWPVLGGSLFAFILFFLLGWKVFGWPIAG